MPNTTSSKLETATFAGGCFWCTEAIFQRLIGVTNVVPGYAGGTVADPTYDQVSDGNTGHAEATQVTFDPAQISYDKLLEIFWHTHNPTTLNRQGNDVGTQYRSVIFYHNDHQKQLAEKSKQALADAHEYPDPIVTKIEPFTKFYLAEDYHQNYFNHHQDAPYCNFVIDPKVKKLLDHYSKNVKPEYLTQP